MRAAVTGATGLVGANLCEALLSDGHEVIATRRGSSKAAHLAHLSIDWREADLSDRDALARAFEGADVVFHCAAVVSVMPRVTEALRQGNVVGTDNVLDAVRRAGVERLVHCSSVVAAGVSDGSRDVTEEDPWNLPDYGLDDGYATTKRESQQRVLEASTRDVNAVVVQPTYMLGPYDIKPSSGMLVVDLARGRIPFHAPGNQNIVDVRDVARGMILAWERGARGQTYILGGENMSYRELFDRLARILGVRAPRYQAPFPLALAVGLIGEGLTALRGELALSRTAVRYAYARGFRFSSERAKRELGYAPRDPEEGMRAGIEWMRAQRMIA